MPALHISHFSQTSATVGMVMAATTTVTAAADGSNSHSHHLNSPLCHAPPSHLPPPTSEGIWRIFVYLRDLSLLSERAPCRRTAVSLNLNVSHFVRTISIQYSNQKEKFGNRVSRILRVPTLCNKWTFELDSVVNELLESNREQMIAF